MPFKTRAYGMIRLNRATSWQVAGNIQLVNKKAYTHLQTLLLQEIPAQERGLSLFGR